MSDEDVVRGLDGPLLRKPFLHDELLATVRTAIDGTERTG